MKQYKHKYNTKLRKYYKNDLTYIQAVYRNNKELIDTKNEGISLPPYKVFKQDVLDYMEEQNVSVSKAIGKVFRSRKYLSESELAKENLIKGLKSEGLYKKFRELTKIKGKYTKFEEDKLQYIGDNTYRYGDILYIYKVDKYSTGDSHLKLRLR